MASKTMGTPRGCVDLKEAAKILGVSGSTVRRFAERGLLHPMWSGKRRYFRREDLIAFQKVFDRKMDMAEVSVLALRAFTRAETLERKFDEVTQLLGLGNYTLETDPASVLEVYRDTQARLEDTPPVLPAEVFAIAKRLLALNESYLELVRRVTGAKEPWGVFLDLATHLCALAPKTYFTSEPELAVAYGYIEAARRHLRPLAFCYVRQYEGAKTARQTFGVQYTYLDTLAATLLTH